MGDKSIKTPRWRVLKKQANNLNSEAFQHAQKIYPKGILIDIRMSWEYEDGHIPNAINIDYKSPNFWERIENLDADKPYFIYCRTGRRSIEVCNNMRQGGFESDLVFHLQKGFRQWEKDYPDEISSSN